MKIEDDSIMEIQDDLIKVHERFKVLQDTINVLQFGLDAVKDDNGRYAVSSLSVIEEQLEILYLKMSGIVSAMDTIIHCSKQALENV